jgi:hypothetical protein
MAPKKSAVPKAATKTAPKKTAAKSAAPTKNEAEPGKPKSSRDLLFTNANITQLRTVSSPLSPLRAPLQLPRSAKL